MCSAHFRKDLFVFKGHTSKTTLKEDAVPTTFDWQINPKERKDRVTAAAVKAEMWIYLLLSCKGNLPCLIIYGLA